MASVADWPSMPVWSWVLMSRRGRKSSTPIISTMRRVESSMRPASTRQAP